MEQASHRRGNVVQNVCWPMCYHFNLFILIFYVDEYVKMMKSIRPSVLKLYDTWHLLDENYDLLCTLVLFLPIAL